METGIGLANLIERLVGCTGRLAGRIEEFVAAELELVWRDVDLLQAVAFGLEVGCLRVQGIGLVGESLGHDHWCELDARAIGARIVLVTLGVVAHGCGFFAQRSTCRLQTSYGVIVVLDEGITFAHEALVRGQVCFDLLENLGCSAANAFV